MIVPGSIHTRLGLLLACAAPAALALPTSAYAQEAESRQNFTIPAGPLADALRAYSAATGMQLAYSSELVEGKRSPGANGVMTRSEALTRVLAGTELSGNVAGNTATITGTTLADGERVTGAVRVEGAQGSPYFGGAGQAAGVNGTNGSRDVTATEGTGSFTSGALTIGSKAPQAIKDIPQSLSVLTAERLEQQNVTDFTSAMRQLPGLTLVQGTTSLENKFYSRGFPITSIQIDGGAPLTTNVNGIGNPGFYPQIDTSVYDHVELLRGAAGQFNGYGDPGGSVNLVRKKPLDHGQVVIEGQAGSWNTYRLVTDLTSPLALDGHLRGRMVMTFQDNHYFYDTAKDDKTLIYGIAELDVTPTTLLTGGISYTRQNSVPWSSGLPRYQNGNDLNLPRSTCLCFAWNRWDFKTTEIFGSLEQKLGSDWTIKVNLTNNRQRSNQKVGYNFGTVVPTTLTGPSLRDLKLDFASTQFSAEAVVSGAVTLFGQRQEITAGINRVNSSGAGATSYVSTYTNNSAPAIDVFHFDPSNPAFREPRDGLPSSRNPEFGQVQSVAYINLRLTAFDRLHLTTGLHWSRWEYKNASEYLCTTTTGSCAGMKIGDVYYSGRTTYHDQDKSWPPAVSLSFDVTKRLTAYVGYTDIYVSQANSLDTDHNPLPPVTGSNLEAGIKWAARDGRLNVDLSVYRIKRNGYAMLAPGTIQQTVAPGVTCCYVRDSNRTDSSQGIDLDVTGELRPGWQIAASYNYNDNKEVGSYFGIGEGYPVTSLQPKHLYKLWTSFDFGAAGAKGPLGGLTIGLGVNGQSAAFYAGTVCPTDYYSPYPSFPSYRLCIDPEVPFNFTVPAYAVASARIDYRLSKHWALAINLDNIFDKTYYQTVGNQVTGGNWYGAPRGVTATLRAKW